MEHITAPENTDFLFGLNIPQAKGERRVAQTTIDQLRAEKVALEDTLDTVGKEFRLQVVQVYFFACLHDDKGG